MYMVRLVYHVVVRRHVLQHNMLQCAHVPLNMSPFTCCTAVAATVTWNLLTERGSLSVISQISSVRDQLNDGYTFVIAAATAAVPYFVA
jgi:hypothetical protein